MTEQELDDIKERLLQNKYLLPLQYKEIMKALENQIQKKPKEYGDKFYACPSCGNVDDEVIAWRPLPEPCKP